MNKATGDMILIQACDQCYVFYPNNGLYAAVNHRSIVTLCQDVSPSNNNDATLRYFKQCQTLMLQMGGAFLCLHKIHFKG